MAMALPVPGGEAPDDAPPPYEGASVEQTFELFSAVAPKGWRVELIEGEIKVVPPANGQHEEIVTEVVEQVVRGRNDRSLRSYTGIGLHLPDDSRVIPDLVLAPKGSFADKQEWHPTDPVLLVAEVTSPSTAGRDRVEKIRGYANADIPVYLLIDREAAQVVVCWEPSVDAYRHTSSHQLGAVVSLPEPLGFDLDTSEF
ncbi:Uma2 family endonuclease [Streptomyces sp. NPDC048659]|uniref:Uma2 family endonuclease n=1 Tax=Streptomyces sp. NPDC048659 TaxID=3155489 RepID=UPI0034265FF0